MWLRSEGIASDGNKIGRVRRSKGLCDNDGGVGRGSGIRDAFEVLETTTEASKEEDEHEEYNNENRCVGGVYTTRPSNQRPRERRNKINDGPGVLTTTTEC